MNSFEGINKNVDKYLLYALFNKNPLKTNKKNKSKIYNLLYDLADIQFKKYNPCKIKNEKCADSKKNSWINPWFTCCSICKHLSKKGCTVKSLSCKLYICQIKGYKKMGFYLSYLKLIARLYNIKSGYRESKKEMLK